MQKSDYQPVDDAAVSRRAGARPVQEPTKPAQGRRGFLGAPVRDQCRSMTSEYSLDFVFLGAPVRDQCRRFDLFETPWGGFLGAPVRDQCRSLPKKKLVVAMVSRRAGARPVQETGFRGCAGTEFLGAPVRDQCRRKTKPESRFTMFLGAPVRDQCRSHRQRYTLRTSF